MSETARSEQLTLFSVGKQEVTVRFQGHAENLAGGLYACIMLKSP